MRNFQEELDTAFRVIELAHNKYYYTGKKADLKAVRAAEEAFNKIAADYDAHSANMHRIGDEFCKSFVRMANTGGER